MKETVLQNYMQLKTEVYESIIPKSIEHAILSEANWLGRGNLMSGEDVGFFVEVGDIVYMDYGQAYLNEMGYQHFGLVMAISEKKALVIPMTSNAKTYANAYDPESNPEGKKNLFPLPGIIDGLCKKSVLFLNDMKFVKTARMIEKKAHIDVKSPVFRKIQLRIMMLLFQNPSVI